MAQCWFVIHEGDAFITTDEKVAHSFVYETIFPVESLGTALHIKEMYNAYKPKNGVAVDHSSKVEVLEVEIDEYKAINASLVARIDELLERDDIKQNTVRRYRAMLHKVMNWLALDTVLERTHRQRNEAHRQEVNAINYLLSLEPEKLSPSEDTEHIPF